MRKPRKTISFNLYELKILYILFAESNLTDTYLFEKIDGALCEVFEKKTEYLKRKRQ